MSGDRETLAVYDRKADYYAQRFANRDQPGLDAFIAALPRGARVLDLGCGPGDAAARMQAAGLSVDALDGSEAMVALARDRGVSARLAFFSDPLEAGAYYGVWASFSLLHAPRRDMPAHLAAVHAALVPDGLFVVGLKTGTGEARDALGRRYTYYTEPEISQLLLDAGFRVEARAYGEGVGLAGNLDPWMVVTVRA